MNINHEKESLYEDGVDETQIQPGDWNANHIITVVSIPEAADLNDYTNIGIFHQTLPAQALLELNYPVEEVGLLEVISDGGTTLQKYTTDAATYVTYVRIFLTTTWSSWVRLLDSVDLTTINEDISEKVAITSYTAGDILDKIKTVDGAGSGLDADTLDGVQYSTIESAINSKLASSGYTAADILTKIKTVDGTASGLDADLLDGQEGIYYLPASSYTAADVLTKIKTVDGPGSGLDADTVDGVQYSAIESAINAKLASSSYTAADVLTKIKTVDGAGSGLDADLLDGANPSATGGTANAIVKARAGGTISPDYLPLSEKSGTFKIPQLIERRVISSGSPVSYSTFTGLNGNADGEYVLKFNIYKNGTGDIQFLLQFNGDTGYNYAGQVKSFIDTGGSVTEDPASLSEQILRVGETRWNAVNWVSGEAGIEPVSGKPRWVRGKSSFMATQAASGFNTFSGFWNNTGSNITSLTFRTTSSTYYGTIELVKMVDLVIS